MGTRNRRIEALKTAIAQQELGSQEEILQAIAKRGFVVTQASLSRDLRLLRAVKVLGKNGRKVYELPDETSYKRVSQSRSTQEMPLTTGFESIHFSGNIAVIRTKPGYAASIAHHIDNSGVPEILGTIAGHDTIFALLTVGTMPAEAFDALAQIIPDLEQQ